MKLLIAIPALDYVNIKFVECLMQLTRRLDRDGVDFDVRIQSGTLVHVARDKLTKHALGGKFTHVLWLDADMVFNEDLLEDMMFVGKPMVTGIAVMRREPHLSCLFKSIDRVDRFRIYPKGPFQVDGCGMACVLVETEVLRKVWDTYGTCFMPMMSLGEDLAFCKRVKAQGYEIWSDSGLRIGHIGHDVLWPS